MTSASELETDIRTIEGVLGLVMTDVDGHDVEMEVFVKAGTSELTVRQTIAQLLSRHGKFQNAGRIVIYELSPEVSFEDVVPSGRPGSGQAFQGFRQPAALERPQASPPAAPSPAASPPPPVAPPPEPQVRDAGSLRPVIGRIVLLPDDEQVEAQVELSLGDVQVQGSGSGANTLNSIRVVAATTLEASQAFLGRQGVFALKGVSLVETMGQQVLIVIVESSVEGKRLVVGAALVGDRPLHEVAVRAALDAINRQLALGLKSSG